MTPRIARRFIVVVAVALTAAGVRLSGTSPSQSADPFVGTWSLNVAKSTYSPGPAPKSSTIVITVKAKTTTVTVSSVSAAGATLAWSYSAAADGKDHPVVGNPDVDAVSVRQVDARTVEVTQKKAGKAGLTLRRTVSPDGKTMTTTFTGTNAAGAAVKNVAVYDRKA